MSLNPDPNFKIFYFLKARLIFGREESLFWADVQWRVERLFL